MARRSQSPSKLLAASALAGAATLILQGAAEQQRGNRSIIYRDLFRGAQLIVIFVLAMLAFTSSTARFSNITALASTVALRYVDLMSTNAETAAAAGAGVILLEAFVLAFTCTAPCWQKYYHNSFAESTRSCR